LLLNTSDIKTSPNKSTQLFAQPNPLGHGARYLHTARAKLGKHGGQLIGKHQHKAAVVDAQRAPVLKVYGSRENKYQVQPPIIAVTGIRRPLIESGGATSLEKFQSGVRAKLAALPQIASKAELKACDPLFA
jgi:hypothetical protein